MSARFCANRADGRGDVVSCGLNPFGPVPHRVAVPKNGSLRVDLPYFVFYGSKLRRFNPKSDFSAAGSHKPNEPSSVALRSGLLIDVTWWQSRWQSRRSNSLAENFLLHG
jgi:hypothetical protein